MEYFLLGYSVQYIVYCTQNVAGSPGRVDHRNVKY